MYVYIIRTSSVRYLEYEVMRMCSQLKIKGTETERETGTVCRGIKFELAILHQSTTLSKLSNGTLDVA